MKKIFFVFSFIFLFLMPIFGQGTSSHFVYPISPQDSKWSEYKTTAERINVLQIPEDLLTSIATEELIDICLDYPYLGEFLCFSDYRHGFENMMSKFNGFRELITRKELIKALPSKISYYQRLKDISSEKETTINLQIKLIALDLLTTEEEIINKLDISTRNQITDDIIVRASSVINIPFMQVYEFILNSLEKRGEEYAFSSRSCYQSTSILTPNGTIIPDTYIYTCTDFDNDTKTYWWNYWHSLYPNITKEGEASMKYNCHGYAWHMYPNNESPVWLGCNYPGETYHYWTDGSYISVPEAIATHVDYAGDHSAIRINSNEYISKWKYYPLFRHAPTDCPYGSPLGYYRIAPKISGPNAVLSGSSSFSIDNMPPSSTIQWSINNSNVTIISGQGTTTVSILKVSNGNATITANIKYNGVTIATPHKTIFTGHVPLGQNINFYTVTGVSGCWASNMANNTFTIDGDNSAVYDRVEAELYQLDNNYNPLQLIQSWSDISTSGARIDGRPQGWYLFKLRGANNYGYSEWLEQEVEMVDFSMLNFLLDYDATSETLTLTLIEPDTESGATQSISRNKYEIQIWDTLSSKMSRCYKTDLTKYQISLAGLPGGIYIARVIIDGTTYSRKFLKK